MQILLLVMLSADSQSKQDFDITPQELNIHSPKKFPKVELTHTGSFF